MTTLTATRRSASPTRGDERSFWRVLLAVIAPLPMVAMGITYLIDTAAGNLGFRQTVAIYRERDLFLSLGPWLGAVFMVSIVPAAFAAAWVARRGAPRLATIGGVLAVGSLLSGVSILSGPLTLAALTAKHDLDVSSIAALDAAQENEPLFLTGGLLFLVGVVIGLSLLGAALWRSGRVPVWAAFALGAGGMTHPFLPGHIAQGVGLLVAALGFTGVSWALWHMRNDDFDLAPRG